MTEIRMTETSDCARLGTAVFQGNSRPPWKARRYNALQLGFCHRPLAAIGSPVSSHAVTQGLASCTPKRVLGSPGRGDLIVAPGGAKRNPGFTDSLPLAKPWTGRKMLPITLRHACCVVTILAFGISSLAAEFSVDPVSRYVHVTYTVPADAPDTVDVHATWALPESGEWHPAKVWPFVSETALRMATTEDWTAWLDGRITERRAAGLSRTLMFNPYPNAQQDGRVDVRFRIAIQDKDGAVFSEETVPIQYDNADVIYIEDWSQVTTNTAVVIDGTPNEQQWLWRTGHDDTKVTFGNSLVGNAGPDRALPPLSYPLDVKGCYAIFVCSMPSTAAIRLRLTGDERSDSLGSSRPGEEILWRWTQMDRQHLVLTQPHNYTGYAAGHIDYVKLVPLPDDLAMKLDAQYGTVTDKIVAGYFEPYSWAFVEDVLHPLQHREPLTAFAEARIPIVDIQIGRFGMKSVYETRMTDQLLHATISDPIGTVSLPKTDNVGQMQQYTNTLDAELRYARELGLNAHANFGASNCYPGSPLQGDFSKEHPDWMRGSTLRFEVPEVRAYALSLYREALEIGAQGISIDFCRYPETIDAVETCNTFLQDLRALADEFSPIEGKRISILVRFPGTGVRRAEFFDYATWAREGWVDYLCPSNIQGRHMNIDMTPYFQAVKGTACTLLPATDGLSWGLTFPGPFLGRVAELYEQGAPGVYVYQADGRTLGRPEDRRAMRLLASSEAVRGWVDRETTLRPERSKGIYITTPHQIEGYNKWERIRIWTEGVPMGELEVHIDDTLVNHVDGPPYLVGTEEYESDTVIPSGEHVLRIRARDGDGWLEQTFSIKGA